MKPKWLTPVVTAFDAQRRIDFEANAGIYDHLIKSGIDGIVVMGSCGEFFFMTHEEKKELLKFAVRHINKRAQLLIGAGSMLIDEQIDIANCAYETGANAVMIISPYYFKLSKESIYLYYDTIAKSTKVNIYIYNFPARTGYDVTPEITLDLVRNNPNIIGYKDTVTEMGHTRAVINTVCSEFPNFEVYSGFDEFFAHNVMSGGAGAIGGISNFAPEICVEWVMAVREGDFGKSAKLQRAINELMSIYEIESSFIPAIKKAMILTGIKMEEYCRLPFTSPNETTVQKIKALICKLKSFSI